MVSVPAPESDPVAARARAGLDESLGFLIAEAERALISAAVTGQIDVRNAVAPEAA